MDILEILDKIPQPIKEIGMAIMAGLAVFAAFGAICLISDLWTRPGEESWKRRKVLR